MTLETYSCEQYAGIHDKEISFVPGMNVILGDNEAGKSTLIAGITDVLLTPTSQLKRNTHKRFLERSFPVNGANVIDGEVRLTLGGERVSVKKEWDRETLKESRTVLRYLDSGKRLTGPSAEEALKRLLQYGDCVYNRIVFGSQGNEEQIMDWFFSFLSEEADSEVTQARERVAGAVAAAGGISEELFLQKLEEKLKALGGRWDFQADGPEDRRGFNDPWRNGVGSILTAYYNWSEKCAACDAAAKLLEQAETARATLTQKRAEKQALDRRQKQLLAQRTAIETADLLRRGKQTARGKLQELRAAKENWPKLISEAETLRVLLAQTEEKANREKRAALEDSLAAFRTCETEIAQCRRAMAGMEHIEADAEAYRAFQTAVNRAEAQLGAVKLRAQVTLEPGRRVQVETADGVAAQDVSQFDGPVNGYAKITLPGVGEVLVAPQDVDIAGLQEEIAAKQGQMAAILDKYAAKTYDALTQSAERYRQAAQDCRRWETEQQLALKGETAEEVTARLALIQGDPAMVIDCDLEERVAAALADCGAPSLEVRQGIVREQLATYQEKYISPEELDKAIAVQDSEYHRAAGQLDELGQIDMDRETYQREMDRVDCQLSRIGQETEEWIGRCATLENQADAVDLDALNRERDALAQEFAQQKKLHEQYQQIKADFERLQEEKDDRYGEFYALFNRYLQTAGGSGLSISAENGIVSGGNLLPGKEFLSHGTRKLILLAFRLALLKYYYQDESGVIVLDDILLDMDPPRRDGAARLLAEFARDNQVIFTTCDPSIAALLGGTQIKV